jgi:hypothetical protein
VCWTTSERRKEKKKSLPEYHHHVVLNVDEPTLLEIPMGILSIQENQPM